ncbi:hypothetical protein [Chitinimonas naiadis]
MFAISNLKTLSLAGLALLLGACAHPIVISPAPEAIRNPAAASKIDKQVAYVISPENRNKQVESPGGGGDKISYYPYRDLELAFYQSLSEVFRKVKVVGSTAEALKEADVDYVLTPTLSTTSSSTGFMTWPPTDFQLTIASQVTDRQGTKRWEGSVSGKGHAEFSEFVKDYPLAARRATEAAIKQFRDSLTQASAQFEGASPQADVRTVALSRDTVSVPIVPTVAEAPAMAVPVPVAPQVAIAPAKLVAAPTVAPVAYAAPVAPVAPTINLDLSKAKQGAWSYEVEQLAKREGCVGSGAWLLAKEELSERYVVVCDGGAKFVATCNRDGECLAG